MTLNRINPPETSLISEISFRFPEKMTLKNGGSVYFYNDGRSEVVKIELIFPAGSRFAQKRLQSGSANKLLLSGTKRMSAREISEKLDYYGSYVDLHNGPDFSSIALYSLRKYVEELLEILSEILHEANFPESEFEIRKNIRKQKFRVSSEKVNFSAKKEFTLRLFGKNNIYGGKTNLSDFDELTREDVHRFFKDRYTSASAVLAAGNIDSALLKSIDKNFGDFLGEMDWKKGLKNNYLPEKERIGIEKTGAVQSAIRMGKRLFNRNHPDYPEMTVLTTVLGGYFGSRLMDNLREDKGYTYGVGAGLASMQLDGYFFVSTEVGADVTLLAENEIVQEIIKLRENKISESELETVKRYLMGEILRGSDGVFANMERYRMMWLYDQPEQRFQEVVEKIRSAGSQRMIELANQYLDPETMTTVIVGKP